MHLAVSVSMAGLSAPNLKTLATQSLTVFEVVGTDEARLAVPRWSPKSAEDGRPRDHILDIVKLREQIVPIDPALALAP